MALEMREGGVTVRVEGLKELQRKLRKAEADAQDQKDLMHSIGEIVVNAARPAAPERSGALSGSIRAGRGKTKAVIRAGGARVPYAGVIHYGWPARNIEPTNYLTSALEARRAQVFQALENGIDDLLRKNDLK